MFSEILIIYGDFNLPTINWSSISSQNSIEANFLTFIEKFDLIKKIDFHTAATGILDLFFVSENIQVANLIFANFKMKIVSQNCQTII